MQLRYHLSSRHRLAWSDKSCSEGRDANRNGKSQHYTARHYRYPCARAVMAEYSIRIGRHISSERKSRPQRTVILVRSKIPLLQITQRQVKTLAICNMTIAPLNLNLFSRLKKLWMKCSPGRERCLGTMFSRLRFARQEQLCTEARCFGMGKMYTSYGMAPKPGRDIACSARLIVS